MRFIPLFLLLFVVGCSTTRDPYPQPVSYENTVLDGEVFVDGSQPCPEGKRMVSIMDGVERKPVCRETK